MANQTTNGKAPTLVVLQMAGANDYLNTVIPYSNPLYYDNRPTVHIPEDQVLHIDDHVGRPKSRERINGLGRVIDYPSIDKGRTRREFNAHIIDLNLEKASRSKNPATALWAMFEKEQAALDAALEKRLGTERRQRTGEARDASRVHLARMHRLRVEAVAECGQHPSDCPARVADDASGGRVAAAHHVAPAPEVQQPRPAGAGPGGQGMVDKVERAVDVVHPIGDLGRVLV